MLRSVMNTFALEIYYLIPVLLTLMLFDFLMQNYQFWVVRKIVGPEPNFLWGNIYNFLSEKSKIIDEIAKLYEDWKSEPYFGIFINRTPILIVKNLHEIENILLHNNELFSSPDIFSMKNIGNCDNFFDKAHFNSKICSNVWKNIFTSEKIEKTFDLMLKCANFHEAYFTNEKIQIKNKEIFNFYEFSEDFTSDIMTSCIFGIDTDEYIGANLEFRDIIKGIFIPYNSQDSAIVEKIWKFLGFKSNANDVKFFIDLVQRKIKSRKEYDINRADFIDILQHVDKDEHPSERFDTMVTCQILLAVISSYKASCSLIHFAFREVAFNQDIQDKLRTEVIETLQISRGKLSYAVVENMEYISMVLKETLRKHPPIALLERKLMHKQQIENTEIYLPKGTQIIIPVWSIHHDESYYSNPYVFDPVRFSKEEIEKRHRMTFLPYAGESSKYCGVSFSICLAKLALIIVLKNFNINVVKNELSGKKGQQSCLRLTLSKVSSSM